MPVPMRTVKLASAGKVVPPGSDCSVGQDGFQELMQAETIMDTKAGRHSTSKIPTTQAWAASDPGSR
jgi:hypothetical protein